MSSPDIILTDELPQIVLNPPNSSPSLQSHSPTLASPSIQPVKPTPTIVPTSPTAPNPLPPLPQPSSPIDPSHSRQPDINLIEQLFIEQTSLLSHFLQEQDATPLVPDRSAILYNLLTYYLLNILETIEFNLSLHHDAIFLPTIPILFQLSKLSEISLQCHEIIITIIGSIMQYYTYHQLYHLPAFSHLFFFLINQTSPTQNHFIISLRAYHYIIASIPHNKNLFRKYFELNPAHRTLPPKFTISTKRDTTFSAPHTPSAEKSSSTITELTPIQKEAIYEHINTLCDISLATEEDSSSYSWFDVHIKKLIPQIITHLSTHSSHSSQKTTQQLLQHTYANRTIIPVDTTMSAQSHHDTLSTPFLPQLDPLTPIDPALQKISILRYIVEYLDILCCYHSQAPLYFTKWFQLLVKIYESALVFNTTRSNSRLIIDLLTQCLVTLNTFCKTAFYYNQLLQQLRTQGVGHTIIDVTTDNDDTGSVQWSLTNSSTQSFHLPHLFQTPSTHPSYTSYGPSSTSLGFDTDYLELDGHTPSLIDSTMFSFASDWALISQPSTTTSPYHSQHLQHSQHVQYDPLSQHPKTPNPTQISDVHSTQTSVNTSPLLTATHQYTQPNHTNNIMYYTDNDTHAQAQMQAQIQAQAKLPPNNLHYTTPSPYSHSHSQNYPHTTPMTSKSQMKTLTHDVKCVIEKLQSNDFIASLFTLLSTIVQNSHIHTKSTSQHGLNLFGPYASQIAQLVNNVVDIFILAVYISTDHFITKTYFTVISSILNCINHLDAPSRTQDDHQHVIDISNIFFFIEQVYVKQNTSKKLLKMVTILEESNIYHQIYRYIQLLLFFVQNPLNTDSVLTPSLHSLHPAHSTKNGTTNLHTELHNDTTHYTHKWHPTNYPNTLPSKFLSLLSQIHTETNTTIDSFTSKQLVNDIPSAYSRYEHFIFRLIHSLCALVTSLSTAHHCVCRPNNCNPLDCEWYYSSHATVTESNIHGVINSAVLRFQVDIFHKQLYHRHFFAPLITICVGTKVSTGLTLIMKSIAQFVNMCNYFIDRPQETPGSYSPNDIFSLTHDLLSTSLSAYCLYFQPEDIDGFEIGYDSYGNLTRRITPHDTCVYPPSNSGKSTNLNGNGIPSNGTNDIGTSTHSNIVPPTPLPTANKSTTPPLAPFNSQNQSHIISKPTSAQYIHTTSSTYSNPTQYPISNATPSLGTTYIDTLSQTSGFFGTKKIYKFIPFTPLLTVSNKTSMRDTKDTKDTKDNLHQNDIEITNPVDYLSFCNFFSLFTDSTDLFHDAHSHITNPIISKEITPAKDDLEKLLLNTLDAHPSSRHQNSTTPQIHVDDMMILDIDSPQDYEFSKIPPTRSHSLSTPNRTSISSSSKEGSLPTTSIHHTAVLSNISHNNPITSTPQTDQTLPAAPSTIFSLMSSTGPSGSSGLNTNTNTSSVLSYQTNKSKIGPFVPLQFCTTFLPGVPMYQFYGLSSSSYQHSIHISTVLDCINLIQKKHRRIIKNNPKLQLRPLRDYSLFVEHFHTDCSKRIEKIAQLRRNKYGANRHVRGYDVNASTNSLFTPIFSIIDTVKQMYNNLSPQSQQIAQLALAIVPVITAVGIWWVRKGSDVRDPPALPAIAYDSDDSSPQTWSGLANNSSSPLILVDSSDENHTPPAPSTSCTPHSVQLEEHGHEHEHDKTPLSTQFEALEARGLEKAQTPEVIVCDLGHLDLDVFHPSTSTIDNTSAHFIDNSKMIQDEGLKDSQTSRNMLKSQFIDLPNDLSRTHPVHISSILSHYTHDNDNAQHSIIPPPPQYQYQDHQNTPYPSHTQTSLNFMDTAVDSDQLNAIVDTAEDFALLIEENDTNSDHLEYHDHLDQNQFHHGHHGHDGVHGQHGQRDLSNQSSNRSIGEDYFYDESTAHVLDHLSPHHLQHNQHDQQYINQQRNNQQNF